MAGFRFDDRRSLRRRYGSSVTTLPFWVRCLLTAPFVALLAHGVVTFVSYLGRVEAALALAILVIEGAFASAIVPHFWQKADLAYPWRRTPAGERPVDAPCSEALEHVPVSEAEDGPPPLWPSRPEPPRRW